MPEPCAHRKKTASNSLQQSDATVAQFNQAPHRILTWQQAKHHHPISGFLTRFGSAQVIELSSLPA
jgi:hypothetical protein